MRGYLPKITFGDDGWLEVFLHAGTLIGTARTFRDRLAWGRPAQIRAHDAFPQGPYPLDRPLRTLVKEVRLEADARSTEVLECMGQQVAGHERSSVRRQQPRRIGVLLEDVAMFLR